MNGPGHYREAERLLLIAAELDSPDGDRAEQSRVLAAAQVHATLALVEAMTPRRAAPPTQTADESRDLITLKQAGEILGCHELTIRRRIADGTLPGYRIGPRMLRVSRHAVERLVRGGAS